MIKIILSDHLIIKIKYSQNLLISIKISNQDIWLAIMKKNKQIMQLYFYQTELKISWKDLNNLLKSFVWQKMLQFKFNKNFKKSLYTLQTLLIKFLLRKDFKQTLLYKIFQKLEFDKHIKFLIIQQIIFLKIFFQEHIFFLNFYKVLHMRTNHFKISLT